MDFAHKILNKYGWKEGEGLGKHSDGIVKPLKASMKFDNAGLGSDQAASDFNNHWWERVFNEAAGNVEVKSGKNGVKMDLKNKDDSVEISTKGYSMKKLKKAKEDRSTSDSRYDNFLQSATLTKSGDEIENPNKIGVADITLRQYKALTDEELFRACGGRTAHKGARHGLNLSGKLSRIEKQEKELLARMQEQKPKFVELSKHTTEKIKRKTKTTKERDRDDDTTLRKGKSITEREINISIKKKCKTSHSFLEDFSEDKKKIKGFDEPSIHIDTLKQKKEDTVSELADINIEAVSINTPKKKKSKNTQKVALQMRRKHDLNSSKKKFSPSK